MRRAGLIRSRWTLGTSLRGADFHSEGDCGFANRERVLASDKGKLAVANGSFSIEWIETAPAPGSWNMAVDEVLLETAAQRGQPVLRFYQWSAPTLSLGYFQRLADRVSHSPSTGVDLVRRVSGGGAIVHDRELTYSLSLPPGHPLGLDTQSLYNALHTTLIETLASWGVEARLCNPGVDTLPCFMAAPDADEKSAEPFLCFQRRAQGDVLVGAYKVAGSAQRRRQGAVLQHGSVLLGTSAAAPELPGIRALCDVEIPPGELAQAWSAALAGQLSLSWVHTELPPALLDLARERERDKYSATKWNALR